ncbi:hypothetical protein FHX05_000582 [Rhizobium sp. BK491]|nr:hypothetical protein [Rhizobium sp. BK491]
MKKTKPIRFQCHCFECSSDDEQTDDRSSSGTSETDQASIKPGEEEHRLITDVIGKLLFGA